MVENAYVPYKYLKIGGKYSLVFYKMYKGHITQKQASSTHNKCPL